MTRLGCALALLLTLAPGLARALEPGDRGEILTAIRGSEPISIPCVFLGTYRDFAGPGFDLHLVELTGPVAEEVGVAAGMSGSPVYFDGELLGALSYRLGALPKDAVGGVTRLEDMLSAERRTRVAAAPEASPIATPLAVRGLTEAARAFGAPRLAERGFVLAGGGTMASSSAPAPLGPGSPVGVQLVRGDVGIAATGTVTRVEGGKVWAFGHPFLETGRVELPMVRAEVLHTLADLAGSTKLAAVGEELGAFYDDRRAAIVGRLGARARMLPVALRVHGGDHDDRTYRFEVVHDSDLSPLLTAVSVLNVLQSRPGHHATSTVRVEGRIRLASYPEVPVEMVFAGSGAEDPTVAVATQLLALLSSIWTNPHGTPRVEGIDLDARSEPGIQGWRLEQVVHDRRPVRPGQTLEIGCVLRGHRDRTVTRRLLLRLPDALPDGPLNLAVGAPLALDRLLGGRLSRRFQSARGEQAFYEVLGDIPSADRLTAVVYGRATAVVSDGFEFAPVPPTAQRLLTESGGRGAVALPLTPIARAEERLDGPVTGAVRHVLAVERQGAPR